MKQADKVKSLISAEMQNHYHNEMYQKINTELSKSLIRSQETNHFHHPHGAERLVTTAIENGDLSFFSDLMDITSKGFPGTLSEEPLTQTRYMFVVSSTLFSRAAIKGGLDLETAYSMADVYCRQMDRLDDKDAIELLAIQMLMHFCDMVRTVKSLHLYSKVTKEACHYIETHLHENIRMEEICEYVHISRNRLTAHFKKDTSLTPNEYIHKKKLEEAAHLLRYSNYSSIEIGNLLGYSSQSYFIRKFKQYYGITPKKYQDS